MLPGFQEAGVDVVIIYSVRSPAEAAFRTEFAAAAAAGGVRVIYTVTGAMASGFASISIHVRPELESHLSARLRVIITTIGTALS